LAVSACALLAPAAAQASATATAPGPSGSGGVGLAGSSGSGSAGANPIAPRADVTVSASGNGITVQTIESGLLTRRLSFSGTAPAADAGDVVEIERSTTAAPNRWIATAHATVQKGGSFSVRWRASQTGRLAIEAVLVNPSASAASASSSSGSSSTSGSGGGAAASGSSDASTPSGPATPALTITVYRPSLATLYGPGFYGNRTACGETLHRSTIGVASRTLKCGTRVSVLYRGRALVVPVIDRGPYRNGATWDLTMATARALGIEGTSTVGALTVH
jgi:hypothetical protein